MWLIRLTRAQESMNMPLEPGPLCLFDSSLKGKLRLERRVPVGLKRVSFVYHVFFAIIRVALAHEGKGSLRSITASHLLRIGYRAFDSLPCREGFNLDDERYFQEALQRPVACGQAEGLFHHRGSASDYNVRGWND